MEIKNVWQKRMHHAHCISWTFSKRTARLISFSVVYRAREKTILWPVFAFASNVKSNEQQQQHKREWRKKCGTEVIISWFYYGILNYNTSSTHVLCFINKQRHFTCLRIMLFVRSTHSVASVPSVVCRVAHTHTYAHWIHGFKVFFFFSYSGEIV